MGKGTARERIIVNSWVLELLWTCVSLISKSEISDIV